MPLKNARGTHLAEGLRMDRVLQDLRYAVRSSAKTPGFTALALLTIATGIGINATVFSFVNALLMRPAPGVRDPGSLVSVFTSDFSSGPFGTSSYPDYVSIKSSAAVFRQLAAFREGSGLVRIDGNTERLRTMAVSGEFFDLLGVQPVAGRPIAATDAAAAAAPVAVIGFDLWHRAFGGDPSALGKLVAIDGRFLTIVGVAPEKFDGLSLGSTIEVWTPLIGVDTPAARGNRSLSIVGRLNDRATLREAQTQLDEIAGRLAASFPASNRGTLARPDDPRPMRVDSHTRLNPRFRSQAETIATTLMVSVALVLLIACANVAGLLLSRATARAHEVTVRLALGASRGRVLQQMLTESLVLGATGGGLGLLVALWTADVLPSFLPSEQARLLDASVDWRVIAFTAAVAIASGLIFGIAPALHGTRSPAANVLRSDARAGGTRRTVGVRNILVVVQVAAASMLLVSGALLTRSLSNALTADPGFSTRDGLLLSITLPPAMSPEQGRAYYEALETAVGSVAGVEEVGLARVVPVAGGSRRVFSIPEYTPQPGEDMELNVNTVDRHYFSTMGFSAVDGRLFQASDWSGAPIVVVNDVFAARYFRGSAVGGRIRTGPLDLDIIGVVRAQRRTGLQDAPLPVVFYQLERDFQRTVTLVARTAGDPLPLVENIRRVATAVNLDVGVFGTITLERHLASELAGNRLIVALVGTCGAMALILAIVGVYGIVAYAVVRRTREIGVRIALGATPAQILALLVREGGGVACLGVILGLLAALSTTRLLASMLYGISATDAPTFAAVGLAAGGIAVLASCVPAARALRISPVAALRHE
jgi:putative ABC transport system permease protein